MTIGFLTAICAVIFSCESTEEITPAQTVEELSETQLLATNTQLNLPQWAIDRGFTNATAYWNPSKSKLIIRGNVNWGGDNNKEGFYFTPPAECKIIEIKTGITVTGGFRLKYNITIQGQNRSTSRIFGTNTQSWALGSNKVSDSPNCNSASGDDRAADCQKWKYGAISMLNDNASITVNIKNLTIENARTYAITSFNAKMVVDNCHIKDTRGGEHNNSDGIGGGKGTTIKNTKFEVNDDAIKLYHDDMVIENVTINLKRNGAAFQCGWGGEGTHSNIKIKNVLINGQSSNKKYNTGLFSWKNSSKVATRTISSMDRVKTTGFDNAEMWGGSGWVSYPVFEIKSSNATLKINSGTNLNIKCKGSKFGNGKVQLSNICGNSSIKNQYSCGSTSVTGAGF